MQRISSFEAYLKQAPLYNLKFGGKELHGDWSLADLLIRRCVFNASTQRRNLMRRNAALRSSSSHFLWGKE